MNPFATHLPVLLACLRHTSGPVLEFGSGWFSTPLLSAFATDRLVRTIETDGEWFWRTAQICGYQPATRHRHQILFLPDYDDAIVGDYFWSVVLVDHAPPARRGNDVLRVKSYAQLIVAHDSEHPAYGYGPAFETFRYRYIFSTLAPWTTVVSDSDPLDWLEGALRPFLK